MIFFLLTQVSDTADMSEPDELSNRGPVQNVQTTSGECLSNTVASVKECSKES